MIRVAPVVPPVSVHQCQLSVLINATFLCPSVPYQCHISVPTSAHQCHYQCPSELPFSVTYHHASQCHLSMPVSATYQCRQSVPISAANQ
ncbi:unnamed protein product, partial [Staurois parvus]